MKCHELHTVIFVLHKQYYSGILEALSALKHKLTESLSSYSQ